LVREQGANLLCHLVTIEIEPCIHWQRGRQLVVELRHADLEFPGRVAQHSKGIPLLPKMRTELYTTLDIW
jgi:hypothetical protein